ncbi:MAG: tRNA pseudouridine(38-40) synthase TruA [Acidobacteria bacterium]|nr:tRNA pseudouridine(38-40) synthase TruA [Acidobacteriota bacterium]
MPRYKLVLEYAGTRYSGWQIQKNARTIQGELHKALGEALTNPQFETYGSGRTDAGVHALAQVVHLDLPSLLPTDTLVSRINDGLPHDINVISAERVAPRFHARHSAVARHYLYQISTRRSAFHKPYIWWVKEPLDLARMRDAAARLTGFADFRAFTDDDPEEKSTQVLLTRLEITEADPLILVHVSGSHFLWKMVRRLVGILVACGKGELSPQQVERLLAGDSPLPAQLTAPAAGLFLERVDY